VVDVLPPVRPRHSRTGPGLPADHPLVVAIATLLRVEEQMGAMWTMVREAIEALPVPDMRIAPPRAEPTWRTPSRYQRCRTRHCEGVPVADLAVVSPGIGHLEPRVLWRAHCVECMQLRQRRLIDGVVWLVDSP
jgi:hypothetical protein